MFRDFLYLLLCSFITSQAVAQKKEGNPVYVDSKGILRWTSTDKEAAFFGVNYTIPFAYGYRSHRALGLDLEKAIDADVYHLARLGVDAFRVHVWDTEISDSLGNLLENEHLRLFDYLLSKLEERNIKIIITPIAYWGNGYPEKDEHTLGFSSIYNKQQALVNETAIKAQENYITQFLHHVNQYTKRTYQADPSVLALEINNEPHHSGPKEKTTEYINRMVAAVRTSGWTKPVFYNISESASYADAIAKSNVNGFSFQWYPTGLVANRMQQGNFLPNVDYYKIPFGDTIPQFANKARMVYEFDAGDVLQSDMYPAIARSFREAGFQWATQFAYDPLATAYANTEYQTHYLNLAYTPGKAISLLIAGKVFHELPRMKSYGNYPADTLFGNFRVSYRNNLSEMNSDSEFYYSNTTSTLPKNVNALKHIAGVGSSPIVKYTGTGAYFLDKMEDGIWRLEVMPDIIQIKDPFEKASPKREVTRVQNNLDFIQINLASLTDRFQVLNLRNDSMFSLVFDQSRFGISPGIYLLVSDLMLRGNPQYLKVREIKSSNKRLSNIGLREYYEPASLFNDVVIVHHPITEVSESMPFVINATFAGLDSSSGVKVELRTSGRWQTMEMQQLNNMNYSIVVPATIVTRGVLNYRFIVQHNNQTSVFPGNYVGDPYAWDSYGNETYETRVVPSSEPIEIFNANTDKTINQYNANWRNNSFGISTTSTPHQLSLNITNRNKQLTGFQYYFSDKVNGRQSELASMTSVIIKARSTQGSSILHLSLITRDGQAFSTPVNLGDEFKEVKISLNDFKPDSMLLLPRPYPGFLHLYFKSAEETKLSPADIEKIEVIFDEQGTVEIETIWLTKN